jgi:hypothetical protein
MTINDNKEDLRQKKITTDEGALDMMWKVNFGLKLISPIECHEFGTYLD